VTGLLLLAILIYGAATVWIEQRWVLSALEGAVFLCSAASAGRAVMGRPLSRCGWIPLAFGGIALWGIVQLAAGWTVMSADTADTALYWLAAACLAWLGIQASAKRANAERFLRGAAVAGSVICVVGLLHLYTSDGRVFWVFPSGYESRIPGPFVSRNNYAAFVELLLPVVFVLSMKRGRGYLVAAAALVAAAIASGSRAGAVLVVLEALALLLQARRQRAAVAATCLFVALAVLFMAVAGNKYVWDRLIHDGDPYVLRREFLVSTLAMVRARPLHGFGLGAWTSAYPQFAVIDAGKLANHAHNEWAQWAAEGGLPAFVLMLAVFLWTVRAANRSWWGIGLVAVMIHSLVDYPFLRLGLAAWIFVFLGALEADLRREPALRPRWYPLSRVAAGAAIPLLLSCAVYTARLGWADTLYRRGTLASLERALELGSRPAEYELALSQVDLARPIPHLQQAVALNPLATNARLQLAAELESSGEATHAEQELLEAARHDRQFAPAWALANFYFRNGRPDQVWPWVMAGAKVYRGDLRPLFDLCYLVSENADGALANAVQGRPEAKRQFLYYLLEHHRLTAAHTEALEIARHAEIDDRDALLGYIDAALLAGNGDAAWEVWQRLCPRLVPCEDATHGVVNGDFAAPILNRGFDWLLPSPAGVAATQVRPGRPALSLSFSGKEPEACEILAHYIPLHTGVRYLVRFEYRTAGLPPHTGLYWSLGGDLAFPFDSSETWSPAEWRFLPTAEMGRLSLGYRRYPGTTRLEGAVLLRNVRLKREEAAVFAQ
jgi:O-antigen ligase